MITAERSAAELLMAPDTDGAGEASQKQQY